MKIGSLLIALFLLLRLIVPIFLGLSGEELIAQMLNAGFRAACALAAHNPGEYVKEVIRVLESFSSDREVGVIAQRYISRLKTC